MAHDQQQHITATKPYSDHRLKFLSAKYPATGGNPDAEHRYRRYEYVYREL